MPQRWELPAPVRAGALMLGLGGSLALGAAAALQLWDEWGQKAERALRAPDRFPGLANLGNDCFVNALAQCLAASPTLLAWLRSPALADPRLRLTAELRKLLGGLNRVSWEAESSEGLIAAVEGLGWSLGGQEQDLFELLNVLLSSLEDELGAPGGVPGLGDVGDTDCTTTMGGRFEFGRLCLAAVSRLSRRDARKRPPFSGLVGTRLQCRRCGHKRVRHDRTTAFSLTLPPVQAQTAQALSLESCLRRYFGIEVIQGARCEACLKKDGLEGTEHIKRQGLSKLPDVLLLRLERRVPSAWGGVAKRDDWLHFPPFLDLSDLLFYKNRAASASQSAPSSASESTRKPSMHAGYQLRSMATHMGPAERGGHFVAFRPGPSPGDWLCCSDVDVRRVPFDSVARAPAYFLVYERVPTAVLPGSAAPEAACPSQSL